MTSRRAAPFWLAVTLTGAGTGISAVLLTEVLHRTQQLLWPGHGDELLDGVSRASSWHRVLVLLAAGVLTGVGQIVLSRLSSGNGIDITEAIWFRAGRLPFLRTAGSAVLSVLLVGMGISLGREGAPKQAGAVIANALSDRCRLTDEERRLLVACGAGAGMAAAYGVPLGGALFALEVLRGVLALRLVLPALLCSLIATAVSWVALPDAATYVIPAYHSSGAAIVWALVAGPIAGVVSVGYVRLISWADRNKPKSWLRIVAPTFAFGLLGVVSIFFPQVLGNGKDIAQLAFTAELGTALTLVLLFLKPAATVLSVGSGAPGGLFTPSLALGALLGSVLGRAWPGLSPGLTALVGAAAVLAATTQGPISAAVLMMELTGGDRTFLVPMLFAIATATLVSRTIEPRSIYDARLTDEEIAIRLNARAPPSQ